MRCFLDKDRQCDSACMAFSGNPEEEVTSRHVCVLLSSALTVASDVRALRFHLLSPKPPAPPAVGGMNY